MRYCIPAACLLLACTNVHAFRLPNMAAVPASQPACQCRKTGACRSPLFMIGPDNLASSTRKRQPTSLQMYNLPPGRGGGGGGGFGQLLTSLFTFVGIVAFFMSPIGAAVLTVFNGVFLLLLALPILGTISFQLWQFFNTISGTCPNCGAPAKVLKIKNGVSQPSLCFNCGSILQSSTDNNSIELAQERRANTMGDGGYIDANDLLGMMMGRRVSSTDFDGSGRPTSGSSSGPTDRTKPKSSSSGTIIDVEVEDDESEGPPPFSSRK